MNAIALNDVFIFLGASQLIVTGYLRCVPTNVDCLYRQTSHKYYELCHRFEDYERRLCLSNIYWMFTLNFTAPSTCLAHNNKLYLFRLLVKLEQCTFIEIHVSFALIVYN